MCLNNKLLEWAKENKLTKEQTEQLMLTNKLLEDDIVYEPEGLYES